MIKCLVDLPEQAVATSYSNMVSVYSEKGELDKALEYCHKALTIQLNTVGDNHPDVALSYSNISTRKRVTWKRKKFTYLTLEYLLIFPLHGFRWPRAPCQ